MDHRRVMSGEQKGLSAICLRVVLRAGSWAYSAAVAVRNRRFDKNAADIQHSDVPVISVGNLTTGGTGKTPIVCFLAKWFRAQGVRVAIVSRGYGRGDADENDEALELHSRLPDVPHVQNPDRVEAARIAVEELESQLILMDDGFQHRRLHRDLNIVVIDATCPFGYGYQLPRGLLRESVAGIRRADVAIISRCNAVSQTVIDEIVATIRQHHAAIAIVHSNHEPKSLLEYPSRSQSIDTIVGKDLAAFCAIGNPDAFIQTVESCGANVAAMKSLPDHDPYEPATVSELQDWIRGLGDQVSHVVCTHKDLVKLRTDQLGGLPLSAIQIELTVLDGMNVLETALRSIEIEP